MLGKKGVLLVIVLFAAAVLFTGEARGRLDRLTEPFRNDMREVLYMPRGDALKILACGFDSPLADALYIKGLVFYANSFDIPNEERGAARDYSYALFDVITDLSPRFHRAYQTGGTLLGSTSSLKASYDSVQLLEKGVQYWSELEKKGEKVSVDPRWLFHVMQAVTYNVNIQGKLHNAGKADEAAEARQNAAEQFRYAALSPNAPPYVLEAAAGFQRTRSGKAAVEDSAVTTQRLWNELRESALARGEKEVAEDLAERLKVNGEFIRNVRETRNAERLFSQAGKAFLAARGRRPHSLGELVQTGFLRGEPRRLPLDHGLQRDVLLPLPDGSFKSKRLSDMETDLHIQVFFDALIHYRRAHKKAAPNLQALVDSKVLDALPSPPLAALGQRYDYNPEAGKVESVMPLMPF